MYGYPYSRRTAFSHISAKGVRMEMDAFEQTMYWLLSGSKGAINRARILTIVEKSPCNLNELSKKVGLNYKTVQHHAQLLVDNRLLVTKGSRYGQVFFLSENLLEKKELFVKLIQESIEDMPAEGDASSENTTGNETKNPVIKKEGDHSS